PEATPPARLRRRILASIGMEPGRSWMWSWAAVAAGLAVAAFIYMGQARQARTELAETRSELKETASRLTTTVADRSRLQKALQLLEQPETQEVSFGGGAPRPPHGRVLVNPQRGVLLIASNLPPTPEGRIYEMWLVPPKGGPRPAGLFQSETSGSAMYFMSGPVDRAQTVAVAVSVEPASGSSAPTTTPIIVAKL